MLFQLWEHVHSRCAPDLLLESRFWFYSLGLDMLQTNVPPYARRAVCVVAQQQIGACSGFQGCKGYQGAAASEFWRPLSAFRCDLRIWG